VDDRWIAFRQEMKCEGVWQAGRGALQQRWNKLLPFTSKARGWCWCARGLGAGRGSGGILAVRGPGSPHRGGGGADRSSTVSRLGSAVSWRNCDWEWGCQWDKNVFLPRGGGGNLHLCSPAVVFLTPDADAVAAAVVLLCACGQQNEPLQLELQQQQQQMLPGCSSSSKGKDVQQQQQRRQATACSSSGKDVESLQKKDQTQSAAAAAEKAAAYVHSVRQQQLRQQQQKLLQLQPLSPWEAMSSRCATRLAAAEDAGSDGAPSISVTVDDSAFCHEDDAAAAAAANRHTLSLSAISASNSSSSHLKSRLSAAAAVSALSSYWQQVWVLMVRFGRCWVRTPIMAGAEAAQYLVLALFLGLLYLRSPLALPNAPFDRMGAIFVVLTMLSLTPSYTVLVVWDHERQLLRRETSTNMYRR